ncbi:helix-turn-helix domain-containing protein [Arcanobacterium urinimassiliense]|uniref:helix-turn-helix domain-containing protein n=1 Tax=Arcanobacterium urinimassiliense TaxID=1871014 RepID=UPI00093CAD2F|nr:helix-turn-helix transcriptional regulator [Arcanobacterium urinimassiliense]
MTIEKEIKAESIRKGILLKHLAREMEIDPTVLSRSFSGQRAMKTTELLTACTVLGTPLSELARRAEEAEERKAGK